MPVKKPFAPHVQDTTQYLVTYDGLERYANILSRRTVQEREEVYVHYVGTDKRLDEWLPVRNVQGAENWDHKTRGGAEDDEALDGMLDALDSEVVMTEEEYDIQHHKQIFAQRNFEHVTFGQWQIKTWYFSPYPLFDSESDETPLPAPPAPNGLIAAGPSAVTGAHPARIPGVNRSSMRAHGRTSDLLAGGLSRGHVPNLWVCDRCFKYMVDGVSWELHIKKCLSLRPPGRKVYQRGAHIIWEVDGLKEKLYCQNLSLFGKLFIDIKTIFFDMDNFLFYVLTDAASKVDHVIGFFSKEKVSYDDYNLACIVVLPPYQRKRYGMLMIEFSYELSRRAGVVGTPERPLSDLGLRTYLVYWVSTLLRHLRKLLAVVPPDVPRITSGARLPDLSRLPPPGDETLTARRPKKKNKGWDGEVDLSEAAGTPEQEGIDTSLWDRRAFVTFPNADGSATTHVVVECSLVELAAATHLRVDDAAFALNECGLLLRKAVAEPNGHARSASGTPEGEAGEELIVMVTREMVEAVAQKWDLKVMCMDVACVV